MPLTPRPATFEDARDAAAELERLVSRRYGEDILLLPVEVQVDRDGWSARLHLRWRGHTSTFVTGLLAKAPITEEHDAESSSSIAYAAVMEHLEARRSVAEPGEG